VVDAGREPVRDPRRRHADRYDSRGNPDDMFGWLKYSVRSAQLAPALESVYDECDPDYLYGNGSTDYPKPQQIIAETVPSWFVGIGVQVLLAGLLR